MLSFLRFWLTGLICFFLFLSCSNTDKVINKTAYTDEVEISGTVIGSQSGEPLSKGTVWIEGSSFSTQVAEDGTFSMTVPKGFYTLVAEQEGLQRSRQLVELEEDKSIEFRLMDYTSAESSDSITEEPASLSGMNERVTYLERQVDSLEVMVKRLQRRLYGMQAEGKIQTFVNHYINDDLNCEVVNSEDINFDVTEEAGVMNISESVDLVVMNYELGYEVRVALRGYRSKRYDNVVGIKADADYFFREMTPRSNTQAEQWKLKRKEMFEGSLRHFLIALASDKPPIYFGYVFYAGSFVQNVSGLGYSSTERGDQQVQKDFFYQESNFSDTNILSFEDEIRVEYKRRGNTDPDNIMGLEDYLNQTSWISLNTDRLEFTDNGTLKDPNLLEVNGYWAYTPVCKMLPANYLPE
ncbi:carboxypeptidase regulatory-like domain-containing protein [Gracilimonas mengyeensis]|uniref:CarboxypepD_reg-like domain-containing protein n=1 Tax=Gracilimonas mengyeensis TaxID=1302730 RepID=A0A521BGA2_9BACT|nr:carboxypeptidase regulatory-like domain-containing protein [Gracilimonas mengyeensis]SMO46079.1 CarboxypepD_reg-like domain-containing protein [Gracilimonas mengyeensis]